MTNLLRNQIQRKKNTIHIDSGQMNLERPVQLGHSETKRETEKSIYLLIRKEIYGMLLTITVRHEC